MGESARSVFELTEDFQVMPSLSDEEYQTLKASIEKNGVQNPIVHDEDMVVIDGHHRVRACRELGVNMNTVPTDKRTGLAHEEKVAYAYSLNLQRRHLEHGQKEEIVKQYLTEQWDGDNTDNWQSRVASKLGVGDGTVKRAYRDLKESGKLVHLDIFSKGSKRQQVKEYLDDNPDSSNRDVAEAIEADVSHATVGNWRNEWGGDEDNNGDKSKSSDAEATRELGTFGGQSIKVTDAGRSSGGLSNSGDESDDSDDTQQTVVDAATKQETDEWSSPRELVEPLDDAVGGFDLDPCSGAEQSPFADETYTEADDGLSQPWHGTVWVNPPYSEMAEWTPKAIAEHQRDAVDAIYYLCKGDSSTDWWQEAIDEASVVAAIDHRLNFGDGSNSAPFPSHIFVFGLAKREVLQELDRHGTVLSQLHPNGGQYR